MKTMISMKRNRLLLYGIFLANTLYAQQPRFPATGIVEYEKSVNMHAVISKTFGSNAGVWQQAIDQYKSERPQFKKLKSTLAFAVGKTLYTPEKDPEPGNYFTNNPAVSQPNIIFGDREAGTFINQKDVFGELFLVKDSIRPIRWKLTSETRKIAGYTCRRANALILDSIYVVAFYTDEIHVSGGPESFGGLPGMILGVALPHENITWFATKVMDMPVTPAKLEPPRKGKQLNYRELKNTLDEAMKQWGTYGVRYKTALLL